MLEKNDVLQVDVQALQVWKPSTELMKVLPSHAAIHVWRGEGLWLYDELHRRHRIRHRVNGWQKLPDV